VEVASPQVLPGLQVVGLADTTPAREMGRERSGSALRNQAAFPGASLTR